MPIFNIEDSYVSYAIGTDLTAWRNADAVLAAGELQAIDTIDTRIGQFAVDYTDPETDAYHAMSASQYPTQYTTGMKEGRFVLPMFLQTGVFLYATLGGCATAGGPTYTHTISLSTLQTPISLGLHFERELTGQDIRYDFLGFMPDSWHVYCGDDKARWKAMQVFSSKWAYSKSGATDIAEPVKNALSFYEWNDLKHASGSLVFQYNSTPLEFEIHAIDIMVNRTKPEWGARDASGYPNAAYISGLNYTIKAEGFLTGDNVRTVMATKPESYAGDIDIDIKWYKAANRSLLLDFDKAYLVPDQTILNETDWYERKTLQFIPYSSASTFAPVDINTLDATYYENT